MAKRIHTYSRLTHQALLLIGKQIKAARKGRRMSEKELAARVGMARSTLQNIERGDPGVAIGLVFEAATLIGVPLFVPDATSLAPYVASLEEKLALLPKRIRESTKSVHDDF